MVDDLAPGAVVDRYRVEQVLASGGFGTVLRVAHVHLGSRHAMKVLHTGGSVQRDRLLREGRIQATLRHPGIVAVTDVVPLEAGIALVMELVDGPPLSEWAARHRPTLEEVDGIAEQLFAAVTFLHQNGCLHRDLKPDNLLIERRGAEVVLRVADFGLAVEPESERLTRSGVAMGTPRYMAPEQFRDASRVDERADVYAVGAVLYELITGRPPSEAASLVEAYNEATAASHPPIALFAPNAPPRMIAAVEAALRPEPVDRTASVDALRRQWRGGTPAIATVWSESARKAAEPARHTLAPDGPNRVLPATEARDGRTRGAGVLAVPANPSAEPASSGPPSPGSRSRRAVPTLAALGAVAGLAAVAGAAWLFLGAIRGAPEGAPAGTGATAPIASAARMAEDVPANVPESRQSPVPDAARAPGTGSATPRQEHAQDAAAKAVPESAVAAGSPPTRPAPTSASVAVRGVSRARLLDADLREAGPPGAVSPGSYTLEVWFTDGPPVKVLTLDLAAGEHRTVNCTASLKVCE